MPAREDPVMLASTFIMANMITDPSRPAEAFVDTVSVKIETRAAYRWHQEHGVGGAGQECFTALLDSIPNKEHVEQLFLSIEVTQRTTWEALCANRLLKPMTSLHTLCLLPGPSMCIRGCFGLFWRRSTAPVFPSLHTLIVVIESPRALPTHAELGDLLDKLFTDILSLLDRRWFRGIKIPVHTLRIAGHWPSAQLKELLRERTWCHMMWVAKLVHVVSDERVVQHCNSLE